MRPSFEKLIPPEGSSIRCFDRAVVKQPANWHYHPELELTYVRRGTGVRFVGDSIENYSDDDLVLVGANLPHHWASDQFLGQKYDRHSSLVVQFPPTLLGDGQGSLPELSAIADLIARSRRGLQFTGGTQRSAASAMAAMMEQPPLERLATLLQCLQLLATSDEVRPLATEDYRPAFRHRSRTRLHDVCQYISENLTDPALSQADIAAVAHMTPTAFSRFFKAATQRTVTEYINELRISLAARMLVETELNILDVCLQVGFQTYSNFNRRFQQFKNMGPREYRVTYRQRAAAV